MKASTIVIIVCCFLSIGYGLYIKYFAQVYQVYQRVNRVKEGMTRQQVVKALATPDSVYWEKSNGDSLLVMNYKIGADSSATMQVLFRGDSVRVVKFHE
ncbi:hypothetical protein [Hymenobacter armeniacus]|uniref:DUF2845 domain-containing protein n=1 Tax=Hymenobacter armeniacus TaxID=2771358 RepID=A0ABR8JTK0_9BACT|nr:hypothetical protein [Hymenobacter armeniacus]MBD2721945.1 hypothetical protein [Hymenobacter armeniacus]